MIEIQTLLEVMVGERIRLEMDLQAELPRVMGDLEQLQLAVLNLVSNAVEACAGSFDLVLTDVVMPEMSGPELLQRLRAIRPEVAAVFMTGFQEEIISEEFSEIQVLSKPMTMDQLKELMEQLKRN